MADAFEFFKTELKSENNERRFEALRKLKFIAWHMGAKSVQEDLIPFLYETAKSEPFCQDDEFLFRVADQSTVILEHVGENYESFMPFFEFLAYQEETVIRDKVVEILSYISTTFPATVPTRIVPLLQRLTSAEWFTPRVSACGLFPAVYPSADESQKSDMRKWYGILCSDDTPMVRRAAATNMGSFVSVIDKQSIMNDIIPIYRLLAQEDTQDAIRVSCVHTSLVLIQSVFNENPEENKAHTLLVITNAVEDRSWRVRLAVAKHFHLICEHMGPDITATFLLNPFVSLMKDSEQEVRKAALDSVTKCLPFLTNEQMVTFIVPQMQALGMDPSPQVRATLADVIAPVAKTIGRELTMKALVDNILDLMKDDYNEVRQNIVARAAQICAVLGMEVLTHSLLSTIQSLIMDHQWRIRQCVIEQVPSLAKQFGPDLFQTKLEAMFLSSLNDSVHSVRETAIKNIGQIARDFGSTWAVEHLLPKILELYSATAGHSTRLTCIAGILQLCPLMTPEQIGTFAIPPVLKATKDTVPNVRFMACKAIENIISNYDMNPALVSTQIKPALTELLQDSDMDVKYHCQVSLACVKV